MESDRPPNSSKICGLCNEKESKYCCPRCSIIYCSLDCYKSEKHAECSEEFYRQCVTEELVSYQTDDESKNKMINILQRIQNDSLEDMQLEELLQNEELSGEEPDSDDGSEVDLHERIKDLNLDDADALWEALTEDEKNEFEALLSKGEVGSIMPQWEPWWMYSKEKKLVEDIKNEDSSMEDILKNCPTLNQIPKLNSLTNVQPSPVIKFNIINVLASYAFITRYFNGDLNAVEATGYLLNICANLESNVNFEDPAIAVESVSQKCLQSDLIETDDTSLDVMKHDTFLIIKGPSADNKHYYCKAALSQLHEMFSEAKISGKIKSDAKHSKEKTSFFRKFPEHQTEHLPKIDVSKVKKCIKKIEYYLSFIESYGIEFE